ncbi:hypothetical protein RFI_29908 [Reticulomyxa filosa]|uniref:Uncharacterized protein n=1 Tax=Reticulomyxa filosa TaxID=46433 RepID=X6M0U5_RETFI|nr:hypothetical protein RFI_29908 [Reticulomyxa filosa]|eukprot:ETO07484.1 hypothetical protein RFI_29908 [Reticulomyxa filosa]
MKKNNNENENKNENKSENEEKELTKEKEEVQDFALIEYLKRHKEIEYVTIDNQLRMTEITGNTWTSVAALVSQVRQYFQGKKLKGLGYLESRYLAQPHIQHVVDIDAHLQTVLRQWIWEHKHNLECLVFSQDSPFPPKFIFKEMLFESLISSSSSLSSFVKDNNVIVNFPKLQLLQFHDVHISDSMFIPFDSTFKDNVMSDTNFTQFLEFVKHSRSFCALHLDLPTLFIIQYHKQLFLDFLMQNEDNFLQYLSVAIPNNPELTDYLLKKQLSPFILCYSRHLTTLTIHFTGPSTIPVYASSIPFANVTMHIIDKLFDCEQDVNEIVQVLNDRFQPFPLEVVEHIYLFMYPLDQDFHLRLVGLPLAWASGILQQFNFEYQKIKQKIETRFGRLLTFTFVSFSLYSHAIVQYFKNIAGLRFFKKKKKDQIMWKAGCCSLIVFILALVGLGIDILIVQKGQTSSNVPERWSAKATVYYRNNEIVVHVVSNVYEEGNKTTAVTYEDAYHDQCEETCYPLKENSSSI